MKNLLANRKKGYILVITLILCGLSFFMLLYSTEGFENAKMLRMDDRWTIKDAGYGLEDYATAKIIYDPNWNQEVDRSLLELEDCYAYSTFDQEKKIPYCTNNYQSLKGATGWNNRQIPPGYVHLVINAHSGTYAPGEPGASRHLSEVRQALINPYYQMFIEDFNADGKGGKAEHPWEYLGDGHLIQNCYLFMGSAEKQHNHEEFAECGDTRWTDYDFQAYTAYYGINPFGMMFRCDQFEGYGLLIIPMISGEKVIGAQVQACTVSGNGKNWQGFDIQTIDDDDNPFKSSLPAYWLLKVSVEGDKAWLSVNDRKVTRDFDLTTAEEKHSRGNIGFFTEQQTCIGVTNVLVLKRGTAMVSITARW